jgi:NAD(P)-dependent dehydrogenase (short-subunit alcohol dehydrogenase family)
MTEQEWDAVTKVHLKGTFAPTHHAGNHWRARTKAGQKVDARVINTTSHSGLYSNVGQANYAAAKAGVASFTVVAAREFERYGVTVNAIAPRATTRMTAGLREWTPEELERREPAWVSAVVTWLASAQSRHISGRVFETWGYGVAIAEGWQHGPEAPASRNPEELGEPLTRIAKLARKNAGMDRDVSHDI